MIFQREHALITGDHIEGVQLIKSIRTPDLIIATLPDSIDKDIGNELEKVIAISAPQCVFAFFIPSGRLSEVLTCLKTIDQNLRILTSISWENEELIIAEKDKGISLGTVEGFYEEAKGLKNADKKREKRVGVVPIKNIQLIRQLIEWFSESDAEIVELNTTGISLQAVLELNYVTHSQRNSTVIIKDPSSPLTLQYVSLLKRQTLIYQSTLDFIILDDSSEISAG